MTFAVHVSSNIHLIDSRGVLTTGGSGEITLLRHSYIAIHTESLKTFHFFLSFPYSIKLSYFSLYAISHDHSLLSSLFTTVYNHTAW